MFTDNIVEAIVNRERGTFSYKKQGIMMISIMNRHTPKQMKAALKKTLIELTKDILNDHGIQMPK